MGKLRHRVIWYACGRTKSPDSQEMSALCTQKISQGKVALRIKNLVPGSLGFDSTEDSGGHAVPPGGITLARIGQ